MQVKSSRKGLYLTAMAIAAFLFVGYLFVSPSFLFDGNPTPPVAWVAVVAVALGLVGLVLFSWRSRLKHDTRLRREEGVVSGQNEHVVKP